MNRALFLAVLLLMAVPGFATAHTGAIHFAQDCETGTTVTAHLDENVAESAEWVVLINGEEADSGTGPGPADLGPYDAGFEAGSASLDIVYQQEHNAYIVEYGDVDQCGGPTPRPTPCNPRAGSDCATPPPSNPTPTPHTPSRTLPPTEMVPVEHTDGFVPFWSILFLFVASAAVGFVTFRRTKPKEGGAHAAPSSLLRGRIAARPKRGHR